jgi:hypothetical protein
MALGVNRSVSKKSGWRHLAAAAAAPSLAAAQRCTRIRKAK